MRIVYGINPVSEVLKAGTSSIDKVFTSGSKSAAGILRNAKDRGIKVNEVSRDELDSLSGSTSHQGIVIFVKGQYRYYDIEDVIAKWRGSESLAFFLLLDGLQDPQNVGAIIRTAHAAGVQAVVIPTDRACEITPAVVKASAGATEHVMVARVTNVASTIKKLKDENVWVAGLEGGSDPIIYKADLKRDLAIVVGSEGKGLRRLVKRECDFLISIPMEGSFNSLNAAQAGSIAIFEARRQRDFS